MKRVRSTRFDQLDAVKRGGDVATSGNRLLAYDRFIAIPEHEYAPEDCDPNVLEAFENMAEAFRAQFAERPEYPNARLFPWFTVSNNRYGSIDFMLAWGESVELPHPREHKIREYFRPLQRVVAGRRGRALIRESMDGHGLVGRVQKVDGETKVTIVSQADQRGVGVYTLHRYDVPEFPSSEHVDLAADMADMQPLRFHRGVQHNPGNGYIGNVVYQDDESNVLENLSDHPLLQLQ